VNVQNYPEDANCKLSTYGDGHKLVKVQNGLIDRVAARPRLEAFMKYLSSISSKVVRRRGSNAGYLQEHQGGRYKPPPYHLQHRTLFHSPYAYSEALSYLLSV
jgi:hypothetical protein